MAARFIPTVERELIDLAYAFPIYESELIDNLLTIVIAMWQVSIIHFLII